MGDPHASDAVDFYLEMKWESEFSYLFFDGLNDIWIPKSQIMRMAKMSGAGNNFEVTIPQWLAMAKEMI